MNDQKDNSTQKELGDIPYIISSSLEDSRTISLTDTILFFAENFKRILLPSIIFTTISIIYLLFIAEPTYVSSSTLLPSGGNDPFSEIGGLASQFGFNVSGGGEVTDFSSAEMYTKILESRTLASIVLDRKFDTKKYGQQKALLQILTYGNEEPEYSDDTLKIQAINIFLEDIIQSSTDKNSGLLTLIVSTFDPSLSAELNIAIIEELDSLQKKFKLKRVSEKIRFIENRTKTVKGELEVSEERLMLFREQNRQIQNSPTLLLEQERLTREIEVQTGVFITLKQQLEMAKIELIQKESMIQILDTPNIPIKPDKPNKPMVAFLACMFGGITGLLASAARLGLTNMRKSDPAKLMRLKLAFNRHVRD